MDNLEKVFKSALKIVKDASKVYYKKSFQNAVENYKHATDEVTTNDIATQKWLVEKLSKLIENAGFIGEEKLNNTKNADYVWIMDPIDGTHNYKRNLYSYGTQIALQHKGQTIFSALYLPQLKELYYSYNGKSYLNGKQIFANKNTTAVNMIFNVGINKRNKHVFTSETLLKLFTSKKFRIHGSSLFDYSMLASGKIDSMIMDSSNKWDVEPGLFLAKNAGCVYHKFAEEQIIVVASTQESLNEIVELLNSEIQHNLKMLKKLKKPAKK